jgi:LAO/AO transport system kinase
VLQGFRAETPAETGADIQQWARQVREGDLRALARAATAIENRQPAATDLLRLLFPHTGRALTVGVTGPPGAGKSTLVNQLTAALRQQQKTVGVVAVDPSSPFSGGAILGDRIRMQNHHADPGVFIRSMATRGWLGGLALATAEIVLALEASGRDTVLIETVGVGQDEVEIARLAGITVVVLVPGLGDDVQALKAGLLEIADIFVINKADRAGADVLEREMRAALALGPGDVQGNTPILRTVAIDGHGIPELMAAIQQVQRRAAEKPERQVQLWTHRLRQMLRERLLQRFPEEDLRAEAARIARREADPYTVIERWLESHGCGAAEG